MQLCTRLARRLTMPMIACVAATVTTSVAAQTPTQRADAHHLLRRLTFGPNEALVQSLNSATALDNFVTSQLLGTQTENDPSFTTLRGFIGVPPLDANVQATGGWNIVDQEREHIIRVLFAKNQFREFLTYFWDTHFTTYYPKFRNYIGNQQHMGSAIPPADADSIATFWESIETQVFRDWGTGISQLNPAVLPTFANLVTFSGTLSPAMSRYLDNVQNTATNSNENYARELLELHTLGTDPSTGAPTLYTETDVEEVAKVFTGWSIAQSSFAGKAFFAPVFNLGQHDQTAKTIFQGTPWQLNIPANGGANDVALLINHLADLPQVSVFICRKLMKVLLSDQAAKSNDELFSIILPWFAEWAKKPGGDLLSALTFMVNSPVFRGTKYRWHRIETPIESMASTIRAFEGTATTLAQLNGLRNTLNGMNQRRYYYPAPDGFSADSPEQLQTAKYLERIKFHDQQIYRGTGSPVTFDIPGMVVRDVALANNAGEVIQYFGDVLYPSNLLFDDEWLGWRFLSYDLTDTNLLPLSTTAPDYATRINHAAAYMASIPQGHRK